MHTNLCITHRCRWVSILAAKVTLTINHGVPHAPVLSHTNHCVVNGGIAVGVKFTHHFSNNTCTFFIGFIAVIAQFIHTEKHPSVYRFKSIPYIRQSTTYNYTHRVIYVGCFHLLFNIYRNNSAPVAGITSIIGWEHTIV